MTYIVILISFLFIIYEDFKERKIHIAWLLILTLVVGFFLHADWKMVIINFCLVFFQLLLLTIYFSIKEKRLIYLPAAHLGWGDILFYIPLCLWFSTSNLILFFIVGFIGILVLFGLYNLSFKPKDQSIPLAGCLSVFLIILMGFDVWGNFQFGSNDCLFYVLNLL